RKDNRNASCCSLDRLCSRWSIYRDHIHVQTNEVGGKLRDAIVSTRRVSLSDDDVSALNVAKRAQSASEGVKFLFIRSCCSEKSNSGDLCRLLRAPREGPRHRRAAEQRDEVAPPHSITSSARASRLSGTVRPSALAVLRLITSSYLVGAC